MTARPICPSMSDMADWLTSKDVADLIGVKVESIWRYQVRKSIPEPDGRFGNTPVWRPETIASWIKERTPRRTTK